MRSPRPAGRARAGQSMSTWPSFLRGRAPRPRRTGAGGAAVGAQVLADRVQDGQALADQAGGDLAEAVGAVEHVDVGAGQAGRRLLDDLRQLVDQHPVQRDPVVRGGRLGLDPHPLGVGHGQDPDPLGLGLGGLDDLGDQLLLAQLGLRAGPARSGRRAPPAGRAPGPAGRPGPPRPAPCRPRPCTAACTTAVCRAYSAWLRAATPAAASADGLVGLRLGDLRLPLDGGVVRRGHRVDVAGVAVVDRLDLQRVDGQADLGHLRLGAVQHLAGQLLPLGDDLLDRHRADDRPQVAGEDPAGQHRHLVLVGQEALAGVDDALVVVADLERDHRPDVQRDALLGHAGLGDLGLAHGQRQERGPCGRPAARTCRAR